MNHINQCSAVIVSGLAPRELYQNLFTMIREKTGHSKILCVLCGAFTADALPGARSSVDLSATLYDAGCDLVLDVPSTCLLLSPDILSFSIAALLQRSSIVSHIVLPCSEGKEADILSAADVLFTEPLSYRQTMQAYRNQGSRREDDPFRAIAAVKGKDMLDPPSGRAAMMLCSLKKLYSSVKPLLLPLPEDIISTLEKPDVEGVSSDLDKALLRAVSERLLAYPDFEEAWNHVSDYYASSRYMTETLFSLLKENSTSSFVDLTSAAAALPGSRKYLPRDYRRNLYYLLGDFRFTLNSVLALSCYVPYIRVMPSASMDKDLIEVMKTANWAPVIEVSPKKCLDSATSTNVVGHPDMTGNSTLHDESLKHLYQLDQYYRFEENNSLNGY